MKFSAKLLALLLALLMTVSAVMLTSCEDGGKPDDTTVAEGSNTPDSTEPTTGTAQPAKDLIIVSDGKADCRVIRDEDADKASTQVSCAADIRTTINEVTKVAPKIDTDWIKTGQEYDHSTVEILVGVTDYSESTETLSQLSYGEYVVKVVGSKLVVAAYSDSAMSEATRKLKTLIREKGSEGSLVIPADTLITGVTDKDLNALPSYEGGVFNSTYICGGDATMVYIKNTNTEDYGKYLDKLAAEGYTQYTTNTITDNLFATYNNDKYTVNTGYYGYEKAVRVIIEPLAEPVGLESENVYTAVTTSQITMLGLEYTDSAGASVGNGLSMLIRLTDGRFIIIDGGFNRSVCATNLIKIMQEQSKDYIKSGQKITIAAWIITHSHGDHQGMLQGQYASFRTMKVERFIVNFMSEVERIKGIVTYGDNIGTSEGSGYPHVYTAAAALGADVYEVHIGQVFYLADLKMEILYTIEGFAPKVCNAINTTSLIIKMTFGGKDVFMMTGDATGNGMETAAKMYKDYLRSNIVQVSHHGYSTWGNDSGTALAYKYMAPETLLWPQGSSAFPNYRDKGYNVVLFSPEVRAGGTNKNFKECYVAGLQGETTVVTLPYTVGSAVEKRLK